MTWRAMSTWPCVEDKEEAVVAAPGTRGSETVVVAGGGGGGSTGGDDEAEGGGVVSRVAGLGFTHVFPAHQYTWDPAAARAAAPAPAAGGERAEAKEKNGGGDGGNDDGGGDSGDGIYIRGSVAPRWLAANPYLVPTERDLVGDLLRTSTPPTMNLLLRLRAYARALTLKVSYALTSVRLLVLNDPAAWCASSSGGRCGASWCSGCEGLGFRDEGVCRSMVRWV